MTVNRRGFLSLAALAGSGALAGCDSSGPQHAGSALGGDELGKLLPAHVPVEYAKPDLPGVNGSLPGYLTFPEDLVTAVEDKPLSGGQVTAMTPAFWPVPPALGQNSYYDAVNERLGGVVKFDPVAGGDYAAKLAAMMAAKEVPDLTVMPTFTIPPRFSEGVGEVFRDLTDFLAGDRVRDYPLLANIHTDVWQSCVYGGRLYAVPFPGELFPEVLYYRTDLFERLGVAPPLSADELRSVCEKVNDPAKNRWAVGDVFRTMLRAYGSKGDWSRDPSGKVVNKLETPEYAEAVRFTRSLHDAGYVHPDLVAGNVNGLKDLFAGGQVLMYQDGMGAWGEAIQRQRPVDPDFGMAAAPLFAAGGGEPTYPVHAPTSMITLFRKDLSDDRVRELLRLCDFAAAPIGTTEHYLLRYGVDGRHSARGAGGAPALNDLGRREITLTYNFLAGPPDAVTQTEYPDFVRAKHAWFAYAHQHQLKPITFGLRIEEPAQFAKLAKQFEDRTNDILRGRAGVDELGRMVEDWRKAGGDQLREFYDKALTDAGR